MIFFLFDLYYIHVIMRPIMTDKNLIQFSQALMVVAIFATISLMVVERSAVWGGLAALITLCLVSSILVTKEYKYDEKDR